MTSPPLLLHLLFFLLPFPLLLPSSFLPSTLPKIFFHLTGLLPTYLEGKVWIRSRTTEQHKRICRLTQSTQSGGSEQKFPHHTLSFSLPRGRVASQPLWGLSQPRGRLLCICAPAETPFLFCIKAPCSWLWLCLNNCCSHIVFKDFISKWPYIFYLIRKITIAQ